MLSKKIVVLFLQIVTSMFKNKRLYLGVALAIAAVVALVVFLV